MTTLEAPTMETTTVETTTPGATKDAPTDRRASAVTTDVRLAQLRIAVLTIGFVVVGLAAGDIFDQRDWTIAVAPLFPMATAVVLVTRSAPWRAAGAVAAVLLAVVVTVTVAGGAPEDVVGAFTSGTQGLLSTDWPSPTRPELLGTVTAALTAACAIGLELAGRRRFHLVALFPLLAAYLGVVALSAPLGVQWRWLVGLAAVAIAMALLRNDGTLGDRLLLLRGERRLLPLLLAATAMVVVVVAPVSLGARADPRRNDPAQQSAPLLDPIEATLALRNLDPPVDLHVVTANDGGDLPTRWRTAALESYDGRRWSPSLTLRPIGSTLGPATGFTVAADVIFLDDNLTLVPLPGTPISVDASIETDADRTVVRLTERPTPGDVIGVVANAPAAPSDAVAVGVNPRVVDDATSGLTELAEGLAGDGDPLEQLGRLEATMRNDFVRDSNVQGGGLERALIERFLRDTQRGTSEQFVSSFVLLARSLGVEARVASGFIAGEGNSTVTGGEPLVLVSTDATVWPEIQLADGSWIAYDPVPDEETTDGPPPPPEPQVQSPAAPQPPIAPPPESDSENAATDDDAASSADTRLSTALIWVLRGSVALSVVVVPAAIVSLLIVGAKYRRRRRRLAAGEPTERIRGAWASATDILVDAGLQIGASSTDAEIADHGEPFAPGASPALRRLATMSSSATFGTPRHPDLLAQDAVSCLGSIEDGIGVVRTRWQRMRWRLSLRSLRSATRSPVSD